MSDFLQRLRERKLGQWALAFAAATFALLQGLDIAAQRFGWADSVRRGFTIAVSGSRHGRYSCWRARTSPRFRPGCRDDERCAFPHPVVVARRARRTQAAAVRGVARKTRLADCRDEFGPPGGCRREATSDYVCD